MPKIIFLDILILESGRETLSRNVSN